MTRSIVKQAYDTCDAVPYEAPVPDESLYNLLDNAARLYPGRIALDYLGATTTYTQVRDQALGAARALHEAGVEPGGTVAIALLNCLRVFVVFYTCVCIGAIAAQHNPFTPVLEVVNQLGRRDGRAMIMWEKCVDTYPLSVLGIMFTVDISHGMPASQRLFLRLLAVWARETRNQLRGSVSSGARS